MASTSSSTSPGNSYVPAAAAAADPAVAVVDCGGTGVAAVVESVGVVGSESAASSGNTRTGPQRQWASRVRVPVVVVAVDEVGDDGAPGAKENCSRNSP